MTLPLISVVMSVHNGRRFLTEAIESVLRQSVADFEFIIIDDGSTDGSTDVLKEFASKDGRIRLVVQENSGLTIALNRGVALAHGEFIARMDADDISHPKRLELQAEYMCANPDVALLGSSVELISEDGIAVARKSQPLAHAAIRARLLSGDGSAVVHPVAMFRREQAQKISGYDESFRTAQDLDFFLRLTDEGKVANLEQTLLKWRQHGQSINRTQSASWAEAKAKAISKTIDRVGPAAFGKELFAAEAPFYFPSTSYDLGNLAWASGKRAAALRLYARAFAKGPRRLRASARLLTVAPGLLAQFFSSSLSPAKGRSNASSSDW